MMTNCNQFKIVNLLGSFLPALFKMNSVNSLFKVEHWYIVNSDLTKRIDIVKQFFKTSSDNHNLIGTS